MSNFENKIIIIIKKKRQSKSSNTINLYIYLSVLKLLSKIDVYMYILYKQDTIISQKLSLSVPFYIYN